MEKLKGKFDINAALPAAWKIQWAAALKRRDNPRAFHVTATDMVAQVRMFAEENIRGQAWGTHGAVWGACSYGVRITGVGPGGVLARARDWLLNEARAGRLEAHNFGRGHISGMRFRAKGFGLTDSELRIIAQREARRAGTAKPKPIHFRRMVGEAGYKYSSATLLCREALEAKQRAAGRFRFGRASRGPRGTNYADEVTCPRCLKVIAEQGIKTPKRK